MGNDLFFLFLNQKEEHLYSGSEEAEKKDFLVKVWQLELNQVHHRGFTLMPNIRALLYAEFCLFFTLLHWWSIHQGPSTLFNAIPVIFSFREKARSQHRGYSVKLVTNSV